MLIYKEDSVIAMRFIGGQDIFAFPVVFSEFGALSRESVGVLEAAHFVVTKGDVVLHNLSGFRSVIDKKNRDILFDNMSASLAWKTQVKVVAKRKEVWICYADVNSLGQLNQALVWNHADDTWGHRQLQEFAHLETGFIDTTTVSLTFDAQSGTFDTDIGAFDEQAASPVFDDLMAADPTNTELLGLNITEQFKTTDMASFVERTGLAVVGRDRRGDWKVDLNSRKYVSRFYPKMTSSAPVTFYIGGQEKIDGPVTWKGPFTFDPLVDTFIEPRLNTKFIAIRLETTLNGTWSMQGFLMELKVIGGVTR
jgi:hypothetical protein